MTAPTVEAPVNGDTPATPVPRLRSWRTWPLPLRLLAAGVALVVVANATAIALRALTGDNDPGGPAASTFGTADDGLAALADLIEANDRRVVRLGVRVDEVPLPADATLVVARSDLLDEDELDAINVFLGDGGRVVTAGLGPLITLAGAPVSAWRPEATATLDARPVAPIAEAAGIERLRLGGRGRWNETGSLVPLMVTDEGTIVAAGTPLAGSGRLVAIADPTLWSNELLAEADNAAFALAAMGDGRGPVVFAEALHGFRGWRALPREWLWAAGVGAVAGLLLIWSRMVRFGPPDRPERTLAPPRREYAENVGRLVLRSDHRERAVAPLQRRARLHLNRRAGLVNASDEALRQALGDDDLDAAAIASTNVIPSHDAEVVALGRNAAALERRAAGIIDPPVATPRGDLP